MGKGKVSNLTVHAKIRVCAFLFVHYTSDRSELARLCRVKRATVREWTKTGTWRQALAFWGGDGKVRGKRKLEVQRL